MASFLFRMNSDKKFGGAKISAAAHLKYINRDLDYAKEGMPDEKSFTENYITSEKISDEIFFPLYVTERYGAIANTKNGIAVAGNFSDITVSLALELAKKEWQDSPPLIVHGSKIFCDKVSKVAETTGTKIIFGDKKSEVKKTVSGKTHVDYINRIGKFERRGDCVFASHQLPVWAKGNPQKFFAAADKFEVGNNRRYREIVFALPNEFKTVEQYCQIIDKFLAKHFQNHYYAYAIHDKVGELSDNERNPHVHLMFSERMIDDVEKVLERNPEDYFKYPARKRNDGSLPSFEERHKRGAPRDRNFNKREFLLELKADFAKIQNEVLAKNGFSIRVDHRSLKDQKKEAEQKGDKFLMQYLDRESEKHLGPVKSRDPKVVEKIHAERKEHREKIIELAKNLTIEEKSAAKDLRKKVANFSLRVKNFLESEAFSEIESEKISATKSELSETVKELNALKNLLFDENQAEFLAKLQYIDDKEKEIFKKYTAAKEEKNHLQKILAENDNPELKELCTEKMRSLDAVLNLTGLVADTIEKNLSEPTVQKKHSTCRT